MNFVRHLNQNPDRPVQVTYAVYLLYAFLVMGLFFFLVRTIVILFERPEDYSLGNYLFELLITALEYLTMYFVTKKIAAGRNWARWLLLVGLILILLVSAFFVRELIYEDIIIVFLGISQILVTALAAVLLFQRPSSAWFTDVGDAKKNRVLNKNGKQSSRLKEDATKTEYLSKSTRRRTKVWLLISQLISGLILIPWLGLVMFAGMIGWPVVIELEGGWDLFWVTFSLMLCYPLFAIVPAIGAWVLYSIRQYKWARIVTILPLLFLLLCALSIFLLFVVESQA